MQKQFNTQAFKEKLEANGEFPQLYMFKFIVPNGKEDEVKALFPNHEVVLKPSSGGKYISTTIQVMVDSADDVIAYYEQASSIEGLLSL
ncbi:DUF493 family protein [Algoriphagus zhangzhouensis]|jgi:putative lipoic acid-binding regulatory protein|uniref:DUF493 domain-containing protein n=1 Tax=Algoriphagus zhangzhouensis TaxID=1073327 RepID=A0A1M7ZBA1_9BACT|nr:DUF493 family protein [Algoriphagus zhangzhouensis]TDY46853.1 hypothetical protein A8938_1302 [Algoriphagus zhangzhouensis]SHO62188.1 hypothetical protein SAMN04488108_1960 [Algoriphagus zhangzhouensis]